MPTFSSIVQKYLSKENVVSLLNTYEKKTLSENLRNEILRNFYVSIISQELPNIFKCNWLNTRMIGAGTAGFVIGFNTESSRKMFDGFNNLDAKQFDRIYKNTDLINPNMPSELAMKVQMFYENKPYFEARAMREERIMDNINKFSEQGNGPSVLVRSCTPRFYYGCTVNVPYNRYMFKFRISFIDYIPSSYSTILDILKNQPTPEIDMTTVFENIKKLVKALWRLGISHNDLSVRNILVRHNDIKLIDFGLAELMQPEGNDLSMIAAYEAYYASVEKNEQDGSNVSKLKELAEHMKGSFN